ncbi:transcription termination factor 5, mitochondrial [Cylas formicarius]|uniref:transcription termination factor 5, mitochondrial n=1 Tax=Cylas formicarius TaxID=197179 RepID=UPI0029588723|nr:transcription termination factor 5, mitochondrial [Cylas formicarius]
MIFKGINLFKCSNLRFYSSNDNAVTQFLSDIFGLSFHEAKRFVEKFNLTGKNPETLRESISFCKRFGFSDDDILSNPSLLTVQPLEVHNHYMALEETGLTKIFPRILAKARTYMKKEIRFFKNADLLKVDANVAKNFAQYLDIPPREELINVVNDNKLWSEVHNLILRDYLKAKLGASEEDLIKLFRIHRVIRNKSFRMIRENIKIAEGLGFSPEKILKCGYLLHNYPEYPKKVLGDLNNIAGIDMKVAMRSYPKLVMVSPKNIIKVYGILKEMNIPDEVIKRTPAIFQISPETVKYRLEEIERIPDLRVLLGNPNILELVVHHNKATSRLSFLQQVELKCASLMLLSSGTTEQFDNHIKQGTDAYSSKDVSNFLKSLFQEDGESLLSAIRVHPFYLKVPFLQMQRTYDYLISRKFAPSSIRRVICLILYPKNRVEQAVGKLKNSTFMHVKGLNQVQRLNIVLYLIEKEYNFSGQGVWERDWDIQEGTKATESVPEKILE